MRRREFMALVTGAATWPVTAGAQQPAMPVVGYLSSYSSDGIGRSTVAAFLQGLTDAGFSEGRNVSIVYRWADGRYDRLAEMAAELVRLKVSVIAVSGSEAAMIAKAATTTIPVVFSIGIDPVASGLVTSIARPGGNLTGAARFNVEVGPKRLELLREVVPKADPIALLINPANTSLSARVASATEAAARTLGLQLRVLRASNEAELDEAFEAVVKLRLDALIISPDAFFSTRMTQMGALTIQHRLASIYNHREFAAAGGLMAYGSDNAATERVAGLYVGRILKGEKIADLPVQQPTKVNLTINARTAKTLGLTIPPVMLLRADEVIE